ncbi:transcription factor ets-4 isoform X1 [Procambarus clarkii]|uniref:transcription factor ets-4 isoform X1 n=2 Tax=Procambarus clarkii TaxID=6728 RepID=UPI0037447038
MAQGCLPDDLLSLDLDECRISGPYSWDNEFYESEEEGGAPCSTMFHYCPVHTWKREHVRGWVFSVCQENNIDADHLGGFGGFTGPQLLNMTQEQFREVNPLHGKLFYDRLHRLVRTTSSYSGYDCQPQLTLENTSGSASNSATYYELQPKAATHPQENWSNCYPYYEYQPEHYSCTRGYSTPTSDVKDESVEDRTLDMFDRLHVNRKDSYREDCLSVSSGGGYSLPGATGCGFSSHGTCGVYSPAGATDCGYSSEATGIGYSVPGVTPPPSSTHLSQFSSCQAKNRRGRGDRGPKLWEFLLDLLKDPTCNPSIIRWENEEEHIFRLTNQHEVAQRWGQRRPKDGSLPYDYFARALRYHYKSGMLVSVPERKLVYKFGPRVFEERR